MEDEVHYVMPWGILGSLIHRLFIRGRLVEIFRFRKTYLEARFRIRRHENARNPSDSVAGIDQPE